MTVCAVQLRNVSCLFAPSMESGIMFDQFETNVEIIVLSVFGFLVSRFEKGNGLPW